MGIQCFIARRSVDWTGCRLDTTVCPNFGDSIDSLHVVERLWKE